MPQFVCFLYGTSFLCEGAMESGHDRRGLLSGFLTLNAKNILPQAGNNEFGCYEAEME